MKTNKETYQNEETYRLFDAYLLKKLNREETSKFNLNLEKNSAFKEAFEEYSILIQGIEEDGLRSALNDFHDQIDEPIKKTKQFSFKYAIAAILIVALSITAFTLFYKKSPTEQMFATYFKPDPGLPTFMGATKTYEFDAGMVHYKQKMYDEAIAMWQPLYASNEQSDTLNYFLGVAHLFSKNKIQAKHYLETVSTQKQSTFYEDALYYLALSYLKKGENIIAIKTLEKGTSEKNSQLLKEVKRIND